MELLFEKLRQERKARNLTINQLSKLSNVSPGMLSSIERGIVTPSVDVLFRICNALQLSIDYFLPVRDNHLASPSILRRKDQYFLKGKQSRSHFVSPLYEKHGHTVLLVYLEPGAEYGRKHKTHETNELIVVVEGGLIFHYGESEYELEEGDSVYFSSANLHYVTNSQDAKTTLVWCIFKAT